MFKLNNFYSKEGFFLDKDNDDYYDGIKGQIFIKEDAAVIEKIFALNFLARLAYECTAISSDNINFFKSYEDIPEYSIIIEVNNQLNIGNDETEITVENNKLIIRSKSHEALQINGKYIYGRMPYIWYVGKNEKLLEDIVDAFKNSQRDEVTIDKIIIGSKFTGLKNVYITVNSSNMRGPCFEKAVPLFDSVKRFTVNYNGEAVIIENEGFIEKINDERQKHINKYKKHKNLDLSDLFSFEGIYHDSENDLMNNRMEYSIAVHDNISNILVKAAGNIVTRAAIDCLELKLDFVKLVDKKEQEQSNIIEIVENEYTEAKLYVDYALNKIVIKGNRDNLLQLSRWLAKQYPYIDFDKTVNIKDLESLLSNVSNKRNYQGQFVYFQKLIEEEKLEKKIVFYTDIPEQENIEAFKNKLSGRLLDYDFDILSVRNEETVWKEEFEPQWEVKTFEDIIRNEVYPLLNTGDKVEISGFLSEEERVRVDLSNRINKEISNKGAHLEKCYIFSSYKQGFSWITEKVIPELKKLNKVTKIIIKFKPFLPVGTTKWTDENGAVPTTRIDMPNNSDRWFDLPIRYLQELYPIDDILSKELNLDRNNIIFEAHDSLEETYEIVCYIENEEVYRDAKMTKVSEIPYLYEFPELGKAHPSTGWITVTVNGQIIADKQVKTDLENIWDFYQNTILKKTKDYIIKNGIISAEKQPFFRELKIEAEISDLDYKLPIRKDLISSLDAFHEDLYFVGLDYFKYLGLKISGTAAREPGLIMPVLKKINGKGPKVTVTLTREINEEPRIVIDDREFLIKEYKSKSLKVSSISCLNNNIGLNIKANSEDFCFLSKYAEYINENTIYDIISERNVNIVFENEATKERSTIYYSSSNVKQKKKLNKNMIKTDQLIGYHDYIGLMKELKDVNHIKSYVASKSYQGRDVYAVELIDEDLNDIVSRSKLINNKPVCLINSRHHANEVSSTNAAFNLIKKLLTDINYKKYLEKLNIVIIPFENPDGGHIHYELQKDNPEWKLHVARFNSLGKELTDEQFNLETKHTEALAFTKTWYKWLPDVVTDNHGVPSHEWDQQFSGYVSPYYKGFWLPRALYYAYFWHITDEEYKKNNMGVCKIIQEKLSDLINDDEEISKWNREWAERFEKYAHKWMPKMFPADYYKDLIFYWIPIDIKKNKKYSSHKYPNITSLDWTTEVSDETATGEYLELCARAHLKACLAVFESVISINNKPEILDCENDETIVLNKKRKRPLHIN